MPTQDQFDSALQNIMMNELFEPVDGLETRVFDAIESTFESLSVTKTHVEFNDLTNETFVEVVAEDETGAKIKSKVGVSSAAQHAVQQFHDAGVMG